MTNPIDLPVDLLVIDSHDYLIRILQTLQMPVSLQKIPRAI